MWYWLWITAHWNLTCRQQCMVYKNEYIRTSRGSFVLSIYCALFLCVGDKNFCSYSLFPCIDVWLQFVAIMSTLLMWSNILSALQFEDKVFSSAEPFSRTPRGGPDHVLTERNWMKCTWTRRRRCGGLTILILPRLRAASQAADRTPHDPNSEVSSKRLSNVYPKPVPICAPSCGERTKLIRLSYTARTPHASVIQSVLRRLGKTNRPIWTLSVPWRLGSIRRSYNSTCYET
jgi:hypothetical protein